MKIWKSKPWELRGKPYDFLRKHLASIGFVVYPTEIVIAGRGCEGPSFHPCLDVAATKDGDYYAFEFKSEREGLHDRVFEQIESYRHSFDFVIVVLERGYSRTAPYGVKPRGPLTPKSKYYSILQQTGAGLWCICGEQYVQVIEPQRQTPVEQNRTWIDEKFHRYVFKDLPFEVTDPNQRRLTLFLRKDRCENSR